MDKSPPQFDQHAKTYNEDLERGLQATGESSEYFAEQRVIITHEIISALYAHVKSILDFGSGVGGSIPFLLEKFQESEVTAYEPSQESLILSQKAHPIRTQFLNSLKNVEDSSFDMTFTNGVFHHIPPAERASCLKEIHRVMVPGGFFVFWENNPWNPGTRYIMSKIPFDRDAITLSPPEAVQLLRKNGFEVVGKQFHFYFPKTLAFLRPLERFFKYLQLGGQYVVLAKKSS